MYVIYAESKARVWKKDAYIVTVGTSVCFQSATLLDGEKIALSMPWKVILARKVFVRQV